VRRALAVVAALAVLPLLGCENSGDVEDRSNGMDSGLPPAEVDVATPELVALKKETGMEDCRPGPGGGALPAVTLPCLGGGTPVDLSSLRGPMVLSFWAAWCTECKAEMPVLQDFYERHGDQVELLGVDFTDRFPGSALKLAQETGATYPSVADPLGDLRETEEFSRVIGLPYIALVDEDGEIAHAELGVIDSLEEIEDLVEEHLGVTL
jgi:thiol-disulfide isomerase/thioredoxin